MPPPDDALTPATIDDDDAVIIMPDDPVEDKDETFGDRTDETELSAVPAALEENGDDDPCELALELMAAPDEPDDPPDDATVVVPLDMADDIPDDTDALLAVAAADDDIADDIMEDPVVVDVLAPVAADEEAAVTLAAIDDDEARTIGAEITRNKVMRRTRKERLMMLRVSGSRR